MTQQQVPDRSAADNSLIPADSSRVSVLPSGKSIVVKADKHGEAIEIHSTDGQMELRIGLTEDGPVITLRGARFNLESTDTVSVNCRRFEVNTREGVHLHTGGEVDIRSGAEIRMKSDEQTFIDGDYVNLNCQDRTGYHDDPETNEPLSLPDSTPENENPETAPHTGCCTDHPDNPAPCPEA